MVQLIRCTQKLLKELKTKPTEIEPKFGYVGCWHANLLRFERRKCVLLTNDQTLYSIFIPGLRKPDFEQFEEVFRQHLFKNLVFEEFTQKQIEFVLNEYREIKFAKTNNRNVLGSMNDLAFQLEHLIWAQGGLRNLDLLALNQELNRIPMGALKYGKSIEALRRKLEQIKHMPLKD